ncbi:MAG: hypothetical protein M1828_004419 [Chrysothrix sp. TS-e1954]|nr:MAG: hypothetical protein M1828_004419 [Chrysothrix sp. TS-e1954]
MWKQIEATPTHLSYLILSAFTVTFALFSVLIRNRLHVSEPPLALLTGIAFGPQGATALNPIHWGIRDNLTQEFTRVIVGFQVFAVGLELPKHYLGRHWPSILWMLGPVMAFGWVVCALFVWLLFNTSIATALTISACLTPTDPVLAASVLSNSQFSQRVPSRVKHLLSCESGCNDGISFPFLYVGLSILTQAKLEGMFKEWVLITVLWQCVLGSLVGVIVGLVSNRLLRFSDERGMIGPSSFLVFYLLLALLSVGIGSTLGLDDFLVAFFAGAGFANDGWFAKRTRASHLNNILDLLLNSIFFVYFGTIIPWTQFSPREITPTVTPGRLVALLVLVLLFRRLPIMIALKRFIPDVRTWRETLFCGHFGPMGVGAIFLTMEARAQLENHTSLPEPRPRPTDPHLHTIELIWPIVTFIVFGSTIIHGCSVAAMSFYIHFTRKRSDRAPVAGAETDPLYGMVHEDSEGEETQSEDDEDGWEERRRRIVLPT